MAIQKLDTIKQWFKTGLKPTQSQFWDTWDSFRHKYEKVHVKDIDGIEKLLAGDKIIPSGQFMIFKVHPNTGNELEIGDSVIGYCEGNFLSEATYYGGDTNLMSSFTKSNNIVGRIVSFKFDDQHYGDVITYELNDEVLLRSYSCGVYNGIYLLYKRPGETEFSSAWPSGVYPQSWVTWLELTPGTIIKLTDTVGGLDDSEEFIISNEIKIK
ncbi:hypothetical protein KHA90_21560 [Flavobacterium psychroterrae]|uniref:Uncharacterized protein n=1 Tax=Flavobacterium psychroterrae TaxID=2133767 RepID=A0ABS5PIE8_9FLAO|nr:hypothetical protein [Flavobacterium psychroterrae]MBS7233605.1 hypothetical protein [Flavobacterium psychroterrae]